MKNLNRLLCVFFFICPFVAKASIVITIQSPAPTGLYNDNLSIAVQIASPYSLDTVKATISNRAVILTPTSTPGKYTGSLSLTGLPQGQLQLGIYVKDVLGNTQMSTSFFTFDSRPQVTVTSPVNYTAYQSKLHIKASVSDLGDVNCSGKISCGSFSLLFTNSIDTLIDVFPGSSSGSGNLVIAATDNNNQVTQTSISVFCDKSPYLNQQFINTGRIVDFKDSRILILKTDVNNIPYLEVHNTTDAGITSISLGSLASSNTTLSALLCNGGVMIHTYTPAPTLQDSIYIYKNNTLVNICKPMQTACSLVNNNGVVVSGNYLIWPGTDGKMYLTDVTTLTTKVAGTGIVNADNDVSPNGDVVYSSIALSYNILKYANGINQQITTDGSSTINNIYPSINNNNIVYIKRTNTTYALHLNDGTNDYNLGKLLSNAKGYLLSGGYVAFGVVDNSNIQQVWLRRPDKTLKQFSFFSSPSSVDRLGNEGKTIFVNGTERYFADSLTSFVNISGSHGNTYYTNNSFYLALGGSLYRYTIPLPSPTITSLDTYTAKTADAVTIQGTNFINVSAVGFGGTPASSFSVNSATSITAVVGSGSSGNISVTTPGGTSTFSGFTFLPVPAITAGGPTTFLTGANVTLTTSSGTGYSYQWQKDGVNIQDATNASYTATQGGAYTVMVRLNSVSQSSAPIVVNVIFALPPSNFSITINSATCKGLANGSVSINAVQSLSYTATIVGGSLNRSLPFTSATSINDLPAGTYSLCISVLGQTNYQQCFTVVVTEPKDLSVYAVTASDNQVTLNLSGGAQYNINLNGKMYATTDSVITLLLTKPNNQILITTDKVCQGSIKKDITITEERLIYPNPFENDLSLIVGKNNVRSAAISIYDIFNKMVFNNQYANVSGVVKLNLSTLKSGVYILKLTADKSDTIFKLIKR